MFGGRRNEQMTKKLPGLSSRCQGGTLAYFRSREAGKIALSIITRHRSRARTIGSSGIHFPFDVLWFIMSQALSHQTHCTII